MAGSFLLVMIAFGQSRQLQNATGHGLPGAANGEPVKSRQADSHRSSSPASSSPACAGSIPATSGCLRRVAGQQLLPGRGQDPQLECLGQAFGEAVGDGTLVDVAERRDVGVARGGDLPGVPPGQERELAPGGQVELGLVGLAEPPQLDDERLPVGVREPVLPDQGGRT
jgi:hypothetical protein